ncbi:MAG: hypothetical protein LBO03_01800 [Acidaminococcales bacterium]|nr:hypothetical protein [Acidaminococcales bacterium]
MKKMPIALLLPALLVLLLLAPACGRERADALPVAAFAALDLKKALAAHYLYPEWQAAANNESALLKRKESQTGWRKTWAAADDEIAAGSGTGRENFLQADLSVRISELYLAERARLDETERAEKLKVTEKMKNAIAAVEEEYRLPLFNLKANIEAIAPLPRRREESRERKERLLAALEQLQAEKNARISALYKEAETSLRQIMKEREAESALRVKETIESLRQGSVPADGGARRLELPEAVYARLAALEKELTEQKIAKDRLYLRMYEDIASQAARVAVQNRYAAVLVGVKTNITAADITSNVIAGLPEKSK